MMKEEIRWLKYSLGIDVSMDDFRVCLTMISICQKVKIVGSRKFSNRVSGFQELSTWLNKKTSLDIPLAICMEATGVYYEQLAYYLQDNNYRVSVVLANLSKSYMQSLGLKSKTDKIDAQGLSQMGAERNLREWKQPMGFYAELRSLTRQYEVLKCSETSTGNRLHAFKYGQVKNSSVQLSLENQSRFYKAELKTILLEINKLIASNKEVSIKVDKICKIKGVGVLTVAVVIAETFGFELIENAKQLVSYAGYDVVENQSGNHKGKTKISKRGNAHLRRAMHMPSFNLIRYKQTSFYNLYNRTFERHGMKMKSYVAVHKKLLTTIYALWKKDEAYDNDYHKKNSLGKEPVLPLGELQKKGSPELVETTQGKQPVKDHRMLPLGN